MFQIIRIGEGYTPVIVVTPPGAGWDSPDAEFFINDLPLNGLPEIFRPIDKNTAIGYFSGQADGLGFEIPPEKEFDTLADALGYVQEKRDASARERLLELGIDPDDDDWIEKARQRFAGFAPKKKDTE